MAGYEMLAEPRRDTTAEQASALLPRNCLNCRLGGRETKKSS